jgi:hypothetical protein
VAEVGQDGSAVRLLHPGGELRPRRPARRAGAPPFEAGDRR